MKSNKQMYLEKWQWMVQNPSKGDTAYEDFLAENNRGYEYFHFALACKEAHDRAISVEPGREISQALMCFHCPIIWLDPPAVSPPVHCQEKGSPHHTWDHTNLWEFPDMGYEDYLTARRNAAEAVCKLIEETWKEA